MSKVCPMPSMKECLYSRCGWWNDDLNKCSLVSIAGSLDIIVTTFDNTSPPAAYSEVREYKAVKLFHRNLLSAPNRAQSAEL